MREEHSALFLKYDYQETKDLCKQFLTLVSSILVLSMTFSEKVIKFDGHLKANLLSSICLVSSWAMFFFAIIFCGLGLTVMTIAGGDAVYAKRDYAKYARKSYILIVIACVLFVLGLLSLMLSTGVSIFWQVKI
jgi:hypothetical protein